MKSSRHPHPHIDPRQPKDQTAPGTNPPVFAWKPTADTNQYTLLVARDSGFDDIFLSINGLQDPCFLPEKFFPPGRYYWQWKEESNNTVSEIFEFEITSASVALEIPPVSEWLKRLPDNHPRIYARPETLPSLRESRHAERKESWRTLKAQAEKILAEPHELEEPPFLPDINIDYQKNLDVWRKILFESRQFIKRAEILALAYLAGGDERYARAACRRMASISLWDPEGSSHIDHNDETHMSVIWNGSKVCDWVWDQFTDKELEIVINQFRKRGEITFDHVHNRGLYGITRFGSHSGREIIFLALIALVFHEHIPDAVKWLEWLRPVLCGIWPVWAGDDGAWAEGPSYGLAYVNIMTMFATALKRGTGIDLYKRPFWKGHARWRQYCFPPYAEWMGFGDHSERWEGTWLSNADLVEIIERETGAGEFEDYISRFREEAKQCQAPPERKGGGINSQIYLASQGNIKKQKIKDQSIFSVFPAAGWAAIRSDRDNPEKDIALIFRSSPYGAISHSHANNNDFILHVAGKIMAMPSGYYDGYGSDHHTHWNWHTKSHNCLTLSDAGQLMRSHESRGSVGNCHEDERFVYFCGNADASYRDRAERCRRHVIFLKSSHCIVMIDEFIAKPNSSSSVQWNIHSWSRFAINEKDHTFSVEREGRRLTGYLMYHHNAFFSLSEGWDPPPIQSPTKNEQWHNQYHLRFTPSGFSAKRNLGVILCPEHKSLKTPNVRTGRTDNVELAAIGDDLILIRQTEDDVIKYNNIQFTGIAYLAVNGVGYSLGDCGLTVVTPEG